MLQLLLPFGDDETLAWELEDLLLPPKSWMRTGRASFEYKNLTVLRKQGGGWEFHYRGMLDHPLRQLYLPFKEGSI